jgi:putative peptidoglycan lipid II flippase
MTTAQRQIARAAGTVMAAFVLSNLVGLLRQVLVARAFGTSIELDAFIAAQRLPDVLFNLVAGGALASAFIPTFTGLLTHDDQAGAWRLASGVLTLVSLVLVAACLLAALLAPWLVGTVLAGGYDAPTQALAVHLLRIQLLAPTIFGISGLVMGILNAHQQFWLPALAPTMLWVGMIIGLVVWVPGLGIDGLAWGYVLGAALHLAVQLPGLARLARTAGARYTPGLGLENPVVRQVARLMGPRLIGVGAVQLNQVVTTALATYMLAGAVAALGYAWQIFTMPQVIIAQAIAIAALPAFSAMVARGDLDAMRASLAETLRGILFLALPATVGLLALRTPIIAMLFQRGDFTAESTALVAVALAWYTLGLASHSVVEIVSRAYYALHDTRTPVVIGTAAMILNIVFSLLLAPLFTRLGLPPLGGLALANTLATTLEMVALMARMRQRLGGLDLPRLGPGLARTALATALMAVSLWLWMNLGAPLGVGAYGEWIMGVGGVVIGGGVYALAAVVLGAPEVAMVRGMVMRRKA